MELLNPPPHSQIEPQQLWRLLSQALQQALRQQLLLLCQSLLNPPRNLENPDEQHARG